MDKRDGGSRMHLKDVRHTEEEFSPNGESGAWRDAAGAEICPYLGMEDDRETRQAFPSAQNRCFHGEKGQPIEMLHQQQYCLHTGHRACPIFRADEAEAGERYGYVVGKAQQKRGRLAALREVKWPMVLAGVLSLALVLAGIFLSRPLWQEGDTGLAAGGGVDGEQRVWLPAVAAGSEATATTAPAVIAAATETATIAATATATAVPPTITPSPTPPPTQTAVPPTATAAATAVSPTATPRAEAPPACSGPPAHWQRYVVQRGDTMYSLAVERGTTVTAVRRANCLATLRLEAGWTIYLPPGTVGVPSPTPISAGAPEEVAYFISAPAPGSSVQGQAAIRGTVDFAPGQVQFYKVEIGQGATPGQWTTLGRTHTAPVQNGLLEELWVDAFPAGLHTLRLVVVGADGNYVGAPHQVQIYINR